MEQSVADRADDKRASDPASEDSARHDDHVDADQKDAAPVQSLLGELAQLGEYVRHFLESRIDLLRVGVRHRVLSLLGWLVYVVFALAAAAVASVYVIDGLSRGLSVLLNGSVWAGRLLGGLLALVLLAAGMLYPVARWLRTSRRERVAKYEARKQSQRDRFGEDVSRKPDR